MSDFLVGLGFVLVIEGMLYAAFPGGLKKMMAMAQEMPEQSLRAGGLVALAAGVLLVWLVRSA
jgi:uncharacterized protein YjeT (DUF2065 family)